MDTADSYLVTVNYTEGSVTKSASYSVTVKKDSLEGISVDGLQLTYTTGTEFSSEGITVTAHYESGKSADVSSSENVIVDHSAFDSSKTGVCNIKVSYTEGEGDNAVTVYTNIEITVTDDVVLTKISVDTTSATTSYTVGDTFSKDGIVITATYSDNSTKDVTSSATVESSVNTSVAGTYSVNISYTEGEGDNAVTKFASYTVTVKDKVVPSSLTLSATSVTGFSAFQAVTGTVTYSDSTTKSVAYNDEGVTYTTVDSESKEVVLSASMAAGTYTVTITYTESSVSVDATVTLTILQSVPYAATTTGESITANTAISAVDVSSTTGASVSFWLDLATAVTDNTYEWESPLKITDTSNSIWIDVGPLGIWLSDGGDNLFEGSATRGSSFTADNWTIFCQDGDPQYMTVNFDTDGNITYFKNGKIALTYTASTTVKDNVTVATGCAKAIELLASGGGVLAPTLNDSEYTLYDAYVNTALDADSALQQFLASFSKIEINTDNVTKTFIKEATFSSSGLVVTGTDSKGNTFDLTNYATVEGGDTSTAGTVSVNVTCGTATATYDITVADISVSSIELTTTDVQTQYYTDGTHIPILNTANLVVTATYSDNTTGTVDVNSCTFSNLTATTGSQTVTVTYSEKTATYDVTVSDLTSADAGWTGSITGGDWWTVFASSSDTQINKGYSVSTTMTITDIGTENWECLPCVILRNSSATEYALVRGDNYGWGTSYSTATLASDWVWDGDDYKTYCNGTTITITVNNYGDGTVDIKYDCTKTEDETTTTHYQYYTGMSLLATSTDTAVNNVDNVYINLCFQNCDATFASTNE